MTIFNNAKISIIALTLALSSNAVFADYKSDIIASCTAYQQGSDKSEINACKLYIDGFIDALIFAEEGAVKPAAVIDNSNTQSEFEKRVYRTRISSKLDDDSHQFCIAHKDSRKEVASNLAKSIDISQLATKPLKEILFSSLTQNYPCG
jgi:hypothetical protein